jgi:hypothetical protein
MDIDARYRRLMDHAWAAQQLKDFVGKIDSLRAFKTARGDEYDDLVSSHGSYGDVVDQLTALDPIMRDLMEAVRPGLGEYSPPSAYEGWSHADSQYWFDTVRPHVLQAIGIHELGEEARRRMRPDSPDLVADQLHTWVWEAAAPLWYAGSRQEAVHAAARSVNARMQQKRGHHDKSDAALCREFFSLDSPAPGRPRLRFSGYARSDATWRSRQQGAMDFGAGCFEGIRNPAAHQYRLDLSEQVALEQLAAFSLLARWVEECIVETVDGAQEVLDGPGQAQAAPGV